MISVDSFGTLQDGKEIFLYTLQNKSGITVELINYGAIVKKIIVPDKHSVFQDIVLGYDTLQGYVDDRFYFGAIVGRYGNRISKGKFKLNGKLYQLDVNSGRNHLHGGNSGFHKRVWNPDIVENEKGNTVKLQLYSPDGDEGYPGSLSIEVSYTLTDDNELNINYQASTDKPTIINPTHHSYFNLTGDLTKEVTGHDLQINAVSYIPVDNEQIPTGKINSVDSTPMDFRKPEGVGLNINADFDQLKIGNGYDHTWIINDYNGKIQKAASLYDSFSGRLMEVFTDQPGIHIYTGNYLDSSVEGKSKIRPGFRTGICLETQHFPDSPNHPEFPSTKLNAGEVYKQETVYKFLIHT